VKRGEGFDHVNVTQHIKKEKKIKNKISHTLRGISAYRHANVNQQQGKLYGEMMLTKKGEMRLTLTDSICLLVRRGQGEGGNKKIKKQHR